MYSFDGIYQHALLEAEMAIPGDLFIGMLLRAPTTQPGVLMGANSYDGLFRICLNLDASFDPNPGYITWEYSTGDRTCGTCYAPQLFDGDLHYLALVRNGPTFAVLVDRVEQSVYYDENLCGDTFSLLHSMGLAAMDDFGDVYDQCRVDVAELVHGAAGDVPEVGRFLGWLAGRMSARSWAVSGIFGYSFNATDDGEIGGYGWGLFGSPPAIAHPLMYRIPSPQDDFGDPAGPRYELFVGDGQPADPDAASPTLVLPRAVTAPQIYGAWPASTTVFTSVYARNATGRSLAGATCSFPTDANGEPSQVPAAPTRLEATPRAGGYIDLAWEYAETNPALGGIGAASFTVFYRLVGTVDEVLVPITRVFAGERYTHRVGPLADGLYAFEVASNSGTGATAGRCAPVQARADATPPTVPTLAMGVA